MQLSQRSFRTDLVFAAILLTAVLSVALVAVVTLVERAVIPWSRPAREAARAGGGTRARLIGRVRTVAGTLVSRTRRPANAAEHNGPTQLDLRHAQHDRSIQVTDVIDRVKTYQQFIGGQFVDSASGATLDVENPANGQVIAKVPASDKEDVDRAVNAAARRSRPGATRRPRTAA